MIGALLVYEPFSRWSVPIKLAALTVVAAAAWGAWEIVASQRLRGVLGRELYDRLARRFRPMRRVSWAVAAGVLALTLTVAAVQTALSIRDVGMSRGLTAVPRRASMVDVLRDALGLDVAAADLPSVRDARRRGGVNITYDQAIDKSGGRQIQTLDASGYASPGIQAVRYLFRPDGQLTVIGLARGGGDKQLLFERRIAQVERIVPLVKREAKAASFRGPTLEAMILLEIGLVAEHYRRTPPVP